MKNFNIIVIISLAFVFIIASGCSKNEEEDSPYTREQIIGKWYHKCHWETDESGNGKWIDEPDPKRYYYQFNENGTFYNQNVQDDLNSSWKLIGRRINCKTTSYGTNTIRYYNLEIISLNSNELVANYSIDNGGINRSIFIKDTEQKQETYTEEDVIGKWIYKSEFKDGKWIDSPNYGYYYNIFKEDGKFLTQNPSAFGIDHWIIKDNTIRCMVYNEDTSSEIIYYKIESIKENIMIVIRQSDGAKLKYIKE